MTPPDDLSTDHAVSQPSSADADASQTASSKDEVVIALDAMSGEQGAEAALEGLAESLEAAENARAVVFGDAKALAAHVARLGALGVTRIELRHSDSVIPMDASPREALRQGRDASMWRAIDAVASGEAHVAVSAGNTAALMAMSAVRLRTAPAFPSPRSQRFGRPAAQKASMSCWIWGRGSTPMPMLWWPMGLWEPHMRGSP